MDSEEPQRFQLPLDDDDDDDEGTPLSELGIVLDSSKGTEDGGKKVSFNAEVDVRRFDADKYTREEDDDDDSSSDEEREVRKGDRVSRTKRSNEVSSQPKSSFLERPLFTFSIKTIDVICVVLAAVFLSNLHKVPFAHLLPEAHYAVKLIVVAILMRIVYVVLADIYNKTKRMIETRKTDKSSKKDKKKKR